MEYEILREFVRPELAILVPVLFFIGVQIKSNKYIEDCFIPFILGFASISLCAIYILAISKSPNNYQEILSMIFDIVIQGICCAASAVYGHQVHKQYQEMKTE